MAALVVAAGGLVGALWANRGSVPDDRAPADAATLGRGAAIYAANCASCHGDQGEGVANWQSPGPDGRMRPPPHDESGHTWHHGDGLLFRIVRDGCDAYPESAHDRCAMPAFGARLADEEIRAVIEHLKTWLGDEERAFQRDRSIEDPYP